MGDYRSDPDLLTQIRDLRAKLSALTTMQTTRQYTTATRPDPTKVKGLIVFVTDATAGSKFQGSDGSAWVSLG